MEEPTLMRENQIGITYNEGNIRYFHFEIIFERILGIREDQIDGIDGRGPTRFLFKVASSEIYERICEQFSGRDISIGNGCVIQVDDISTSGTRIELSKVPFQVSNKMLTNMLESYGEVYKCQNYYKIFGKYSKFNSSGDRIAWVKLDKHIPQSLMLTDTQTTIDVRYPNQPLSCHTCGKFSHRAWRCRTQKSDFINKVKLKSNDSIESELSEIEINSDDLDIHIAASQNTNSFECNECNFVCSYLEIMNDHKKTHIGKNIIVLARIATMPHLMITYCRIIAKSQVVVRNVNLYVKSVNMYALMKMF